MIRTYQITGIVCAVAVALTSCDSDIPFASGTGSIAPTVSLSTDVVSASRASTAKTITADQLSLTVAAKDGSSSNTWASVKDFDKSTLFGVGSYVVSAAYGDPTVEGFDSPAYYGSTEITVKENQVTAVDLSATLANAMVSVSYSDTFMNYMTDWSAELHSTGGQYWTIDKDETRAMYLNPGATTLSVSVTKPNGKSAKLQVASFTTQARHHYKVLVDLDGGAGDVVLNVTFDDTTVAEDVSIDLSDELFDAPAPLLSASGFENDQLVNAIIGTTLAEPLKLSIVGHSKLASVVLTTSGTSLLADGFPAEVDLLNPGESKAKLTALGLKVVGLWSNPDKMGVIDFSNVINAIRTIDDDTNISQFTVVATDVYGKESEAVSFKVLVAPLEIEISNAVTLQDYDDELTFQLSYNGSNPATELEFQCKNDRGTWDDATVVSIATASRAGTLYNVTISIPADENTVEMRVINKSNNETLTSMTVERAEPAVVPAIDEKNVFATTATVTGTLADSSVSGATIAYRKKGATAWTTATNSTVSGTTCTVSLTGLQAGTEYEVVGAATDYLGKKISTFTTEAATQLPYSDMETWDGSSTFDVQYLGSSSSCWGTNNKMTAKGSSAAAYLGASGTIASTDSHGGSYAALLVARPWGTGTTAPVFGSWSLKYADAGLLHLGSNRSSRPSDYSGTSGPVTTSDLDCGMAFASRPSAFTFWYKYSPKDSSDYGVAEVYVYDASGNILASGTKKLTSASSYTQVSIPLTYASGAAKAAKIYVKFISTYDNKFLAKSYLNSPSISSPGSGSSLYIDDLSLTY